MCVTYINLQICLPHTRRRATHMKYKTIDQHEKKSIKFHHIAGVSLFFSRYHSPLYHHYPTFYIERQYIGSLVGIFAIHLERKHTALLCNRATNIKMLCLFFPLLLLSLRYEQAMKKILFQEWEKFHILHSNRVVCVCVFLSFSINIFYNILFEKWCVHCLHEYSIERIEYEHQRTQ